MPPPRPPPSPAGPRTRKRRRPRRSVPAAPSPGVPERVRSAEQALADAVRAACADLFGRRPGALGPFSFQVEIRVDPTQQWRLETIPPLEERIRACLQEMEVRAGAYQNGRVYCYRCESSRCPHSVPPGPASVFGGYTSTGLPSWPDFLEVLLGHRHPRVDLLYEDGGHDLAVLCMAPDTLRQRQLAVFGRDSKTYEILGQVVFGFLRIAEPGGGPRQTERVAFTVQAVACRGPDGSPRLELNVLGRLPNGRPAMDAVDGPFGTRVFHVIASARRTLRGLAPAHAAAAGPRGGPAAAQRFDRAAADFLKKLARTLERVGRQRGKQTRHAEDRRVTRRHASAARRDLDDAAEEMFLWDERGRTVVVVGPRNRVHVFSPDGRHVTSLLLPSDALKSRLRRGRWVPLSRDRIDAFRRSAGPASPAEPEPGGNAPSPPSGGPPRVVPGGSGVPVR